ncbi:hypothetical protein AAFF_G00062000 [Aldrovandia affinis]|uniref:Interleukin-21 n=1 Tax=Aldrovandia affinis TaxID=143900 RepID=A0AAD7WES0_9TELE|nr:hypothetical protein AAFF_G00062000 [Aldrovandia affinis]
MDLGRLNKSVLHNGLMLNTPQIDEIEKCCYGSAIQCFSEKLSELKSIESAGSLKNKIRRNLSKATIHVNTCSAEDTLNANCQTCDSYPMRDSKEFIQALKTLLQSSINKLTLKA